MTGTERRPHAGQDAVGWEDMVAEEGPPELSVQEAASCSVSPSLSSALPLRDVTISGFTPSSSLYTPTPLRTQLPRDGLQGAVHARCLHPDARPQRTTRSGQVTTTMGGSAGEPVPPQPVPHGSAGRGRAHACPCSPFPIPLPGSNAPTKDNYANVLLQGGLQTGPAGAWAGGLSRQASRCVCPSLQVFLCFANSCCDGFVLQAWLPRWAPVLGAARPCSAPGLGETSPPACPLTKAATWGPREGLRRPLRVAAVRPLGPCRSRLPAMWVLGRKAGHHRPLQHRCSPSPSPNSSQLLQRIWGHPEHVLRTEMRNGPM